MKSLFLFLFIVLMFTHSNIIFYAIFGIGRVLRSTVLELNNYVAGKSPAATTDLMSG